jgi:hypothetical protein
MHWWLPEISVGAPVVVVCQRNFVVSNLRWKSSGWEDPLSTLRSQETSR